MILDGLALFPLPQVTLFPHALLPLHVFEPRYREMARDCLAGSKRIVIATLEPGFESDYEGRPPVKSICSVGEIVAHHRHPDGRYDILVCGTARVRIVEELPPAELYRRVNAEVLDDVYRPGALPLDLGLRALVALCDCLAGVLPSGGDTLRNLARQESDPSATADVLAAALVTEPQTRQELVEMLDVAARIERVSSVVAAVLGRLESSGGGPTLN